MAKGSRKILENKSATRSLAKSSSQNSFLRRNYYEPLSNRGKSAMDRDRSQKNLSQNTLVKDEPSKAYNKYVRDISGTKVSFLNNTS